MPCRLPYLLPSDMARNTTRALTIACAVALVVVLAFVLALPASAQSHSGLPAPVVTEPGESSAPVRPRYLLMGTNGRSVMSDDFRGRFQLIAFGFVSCPDVCPTTLLEMSHVLAALGTRAQRLQPIFITIDPQRDTAQVLAAYTQAFDGRILGLTGSPDLVRRAANNFKVQFAKVQEPGANPDVYTMDHTAGMFLLGPDGTLVARFGYGLPVAQVTERILHWLNLDGK
jgi:protein SCO1/2